MTEQPILEVRPVFRWLQATVASFFVALFITPFIGGFLTFGLAMFAFLFGLIFLDLESAIYQLDLVFGATESGEAAERLAVLTPFLFYFSVFLLLVFFIFRAMKRTCERTVYRFYENRIDYAEGYWTKTYKSILYKDIVSVAYSSSPMQSRKGIGTVTVNTAGANNSILLSDIPNPEQIVEQIQGFRKDQG